MTHMKSFIDKILKITACVLNWFKRKYRIELNCFLYRNPSQNINFVFFKKIASNKWLHFNVRMSVYNLVSSQNVLFADKELFLGEKMDHFCCNFEAVFSKSLKPFEKIDSFPFVSFFILTVHWFDYEFQPA